MSDEEPNAGPIQAEGNTMLRIESLLTATLPLALCCTAVTQQTPDEALRTLLDGNRRFAEERSVPQPVGPGIRHTLARGQSPFAVIVTCADSRVPPEHLFNTGLGELIVVRTAGHVVGPEAIATIEDAVERLNVPLCVVLGHENSEVIRAAIDQTTQHGHHSDLSPAVVQLLERIEPAVRKARALDLAGKKLQDVAEEEHAHATVAECMTRSDLLRRYASVGKFRMVAARYHSGGDVEVLPNRPLKAPEVADRPVHYGAVPPGLPPHVALRMLRAGHSRFLGDTRPAPDLSKERRKTLTEGQQPLAIVVTDSDSRVSPEHVFDAGIGELYVIRTAGNTLTDETLASIEFAASRLGASLLVVMGHSRCDSVASAADHPEKKQLTPHQRKLLRRLEPSVASARAGHNADVVASATQTNVMRTVTEARTRSALLRLLEAKGQFAILGSYYDVAKGDLTWLKVTATAGTAHAGDHGHAKHVAKGGHDSHGHGADSHGAGSHGAGSHGAGSHGADAHGAGTHAAGSHSDHGHVANNHNEAHAPAGHDAHGHGDAGHGSHGHDAHGQAAHGHDAHGHAAHGSDAHGADPHANLPPAPAGEMAYHNDAHAPAHDTGHGDSHGHGDAHGHDGDHGHGHDGHGGHDNDGHHGGDAHHGHDGDAHHGHDSHGHDSHSHDAHGHDAHGHGGEHYMMQYLKNPVILVGVGGIASLIAAAWLVLRRKS